MGLRSTNSFPPMRLIFSPTSNRLVAGCHDVLLARQQRYYGNARGFRVTERRGDASQHPGVQTNHQRSRRLSNVASRLCDEATNLGKSSISHRVLMKVENNVIAEPVGEFELRGIRLSPPQLNVLCFVQSGRSTHVQFAVGFKIQGKTGHVVVDAGRRADRGPQG